MGRTIKFTGFAQVLFGPLGMVIHISFPLLPLVPSSPGRRFIVLYLLGSVDHE